MIVRFSRYVVLLLTSTLLLGSSARGIEPSEQIEIWPKFAPGESTKNLGRALPNRPNENPPITRVVEISYPRLESFVPKKNANGVGVLILPGGGFGKVVPDMEGAEAAAWLNELGITAFVLSYRTTEKQPGPRWKRPLQDSQRAMRYIRANAAKWKLDVNKIGLLGFSAGGQVASIHITAREPAYTSIDSADDQSFAPAFSILIYPWNIYDAKRDGLLEEIQVSKETPPSFIVHTHDDASTSLGAVYLYTALKKHKVSAELHVYQSGGHGYGTRARPNSDIGTWTARGTDWLRTRGLANPKN